MSERFIVKNNSGNVLMLPKNRITLAPKSSIDLVSRLKKTVQEIRRDEEIMIEISHNNLLLVEESDSNTNITSGINDKIDELMSLVKKKEEDKVSISPEIDKEFLEKVLAEKIGDLFKQIKIPISENDKGDLEEEMRQKAIEEMLKRENDKNKNLDNFGGETKEVSDGDEDYSDLIDFLGEL